MDLVKKLTNSHSIVACTFYCFIGASLAELASAIPSSSSGKSNAGHRLEISQYECSISLGFRDWGSKVRTNCKFLRWVVSLLFIPEVFNTQVIRNQVERPRLDLWNCLRISVRCQRCYRMLGSAARSLCSGEMAHLPCISMYNMECMRHCHIRPSLPAEDPKLRMLSLRDYLVHYSHGLGNYALYHWQRLRFKCLRLDCLE